MGVNYMNDDERIKEIEADFFEFIGGKTAAEIQCLYDKVKNNIPWYACRKSYHGGVVPSIVKEFVSSFKHAFFRTYLRWWLDYNSLFNVDVFYEDSESMRQKYKEIVGFLDHAILELVCKLLCIAYVYKNDYFSLLCGSGRNHKRWGNNLYLFAKSKYCGTDYTQDGIDYTQFSTIEWRTHEHGIGVNQIVNYSHFGNELKEIIKRGNDMSDLHICYVDTPTKKELPVYIIQEKFGEINYAGFNITKMVDIDPNLIQAILDKFNALNYTNKEEYVSNLEKLMKFKRIDKKNSLCEELSRDELMYIYFYANVDRATMGWVHQITDSRDRRKDYMKIFDGTIDEWNGDLNLYFFENAYGFKLPKTVKGNLYFSQLKTAKECVFPEIVEGDVCLNSLPVALDLKLPKVIGGNLELKALKSSKYLDLSGVEIQGDLILPNVTDFEVNLSNTKIGGNLNIDVQATGSLNYLPCACGLRVSGSGNCVDLSNALIFGGIDLSAATFRELKFNNSGEIEGDLFVGDNKPNYIVNRPEIVRGNYSCWNASGDNAIIPKLIEGDLYLNGDFLFYSLLKSMKKCIIFVAG